MAAQVVTVAAVVAGAEAQAGAQAGVGGGLTALANAAPGLKTG